MPIIRIDTCPVRHHGRLEACSLERRVRCEPDFLDHFWRGHPPLVLAADWGHAVVSAAAYLRTQLEALSSGARRNDIGEQMRNVARRMTTEEIDAASRF
jgi:hypothetical protein